MNIPIEILALGFDIGHAISYFPLLNLSVCFFLTGTHFDDCCAMRCEYFVFEGKKKEYERKDLSKREKKNLLRIGGIVAEVCRAKVWLGALAPNIFPLIKDILSSSIMR